VCRVFQCAHLPLDHLLIRPSGRGSDKQQSAGLAKPPRCAKIKRERGHGKARSHDDEQTWRSSSRTFGLPSCIVHDMQDFPAGQDPASRTGLVERTAREDVFPHRLAVQRSIQHLQICSRAVRVVGLQKIAALAGFGCGIAQ
jgi:hypothetical protein